MFPVIAQRCEALVSQLHEIPAERREQLHSLAAYIQAQQSKSVPVQLQFICTHNSRRSHLAQVWAAVAAAWYQVQDVHTFSGGTEVTAFHPHAIKALQAAGFAVEATTAAPNPVYQVYFGAIQSVTCFSKMYNHPSNSTAGFAAVMTCSEAEQNCPLIPGAELRLALPYHDPKAWDGTVLQDEKYTERSNQVAMECLYLFSVVAASL